jgi:short-subunit dehydrogenase
MRFDGKKIVVTGGAGGIGNPLVGNLIALGGSVTVIDRVASPRPDVANILGDLSSFDGIEAIAQKLGESDWDILVNLAGIQHFGPLENQTAEHLFASYLVNLIAPARLIQAVLPRMKARKSGHIVNIGSIFGSINFAHFVTYSSSKAGLRALSQGLRRELTGTDIAVTYVAPRAVKTALNSPLVMKFAEITHMNMDMPSLTVDRIMRAIWEQSKDVYIGFPESLYVRINGIFPSLIDNSLAKNDVKARQLFI